MKNSRDRSQISCLGKQLFPRKSEILTTAFKDATDNIYGYLLIDVHPKTKESPKLLTNIFSEQYNIIYKVKTP